LVSFVQLLACGVSTWAAAWLTEMVLRRGYDRACLESSELIETTTHPSLRVGNHEVRVPALVAWLDGTVVGPPFTGPLAVGIVGESLWFAFVSWMLMTRERSTSPRGRSARFRARCSARSRLDECPIRRA